MDLVASSSPILREEIPHLLEPISDDVLAEYSRLAREMVELMLKSKECGLAAPQVGISIPMFVIATTPVPNRDKVFVCINPRIIKTDGTPKPCQEGCLTFPGRYKIVQRPDMIWAEWITPRGKTERRQLFGRVAQAFCHELDHLKGKLLF